MKNPPQHQAFTLMELLVVIAIIGILASLLFPAVNGAINAARKTQAKNDVTQIANAVVMYQTEYSKFPGNPSSDTSQNVDKNLMDALMGISTNNNPRKISFIEVGDAKKGKSGLTNGNFVDPWGGIYQIAMDGNYDNTISTSVGAASPYNTQTNNLRRTVAVWNDPASHTDTSDSAKKKNRAVTSW